MISHIRSVELLVSRVEPPCGLDILTNSSEYIFIGVKGGTVIPIQYGFHCEGGKIQDRSLHLVPLNDIFLTLHKIVKFTLHRSAALARASVGNVIVMQMGF